MARTAARNGTPAGEVRLLVDGVTGALLLEHPDQAPAGLREQLEALAGAGAVVGCATPRAVLPPPTPPDGEVTRGPTVRISGYYHGSVVEGPGRRSSVLFAGCPLACAGFIYSASGGVGMSS